MRSQLIINRNEVLQGPAPACIAALKRATKNDLCRYEATSYSSRLIPKLAKKFSIPESQIIVSYGAEDFLRFAFNQLHATDTILTSNPAYGYYKNYATFRGVQLATFKIQETKNEFVFDADDCLRQYKNRKPKLLLIASPNNPTGNCLSVADTKKILATVDPATLVVIDEAYEGFNPTYKEKEFLALIKKHPNLVLLRTFSKRYALAGLRIGYALCGTNAKAMLNYQAPYLGMSPLIEDVAIAALESSQYYNKILQEIIKTREEFIKKINTTKHFHALASHANFVAVRVDKLTTKTVEKLLAKTPVLPAKFVTPELLRVSIGLPRQMRDFGNMLATHECSLLHIPSSSKKGNHKDKNNNVNDKDVLF